MECWQRRAAPPWAVSPCGERRGLSCGLEGGAGVQQGSGGLTEALESRVLRAGGKMACAGEAMCGHRRVVKWSWSQADIRSPSFQATALLDTSVLALGADVKEGKPVLSASEHWRRAGFWSGLATGTEPAWAHSVRALLSGVPVLCGLV